MDKQVLRKQVQDYLYTCSTSPQFMSFVQKNRQVIENYLKKNDLIEKREHQNYSQKDMIKTNIDRYIGSFKLSRQMNQPDMVFRKCDYIFSLIGMSLNTRAFLSTIQLLGTEEQVKKWRDLVLTGRVFGSYGQTQLGHGSDVQGLQTQAYFDQNRQVFVLNSPKITSSKFWPGALGMVCTHTVLQAKTYVKGQLIGLQTFIVQIRDENLNPKQGVKAGDIGPKFGYHRVDNGFLTLNKIQVSRQSMLMKYIKVTQSGQVLGKNNKEAIKYAYGSMLELRVTLPFILSFNHIILPANQLYQIYQSLGEHKVEQNKTYLINAFSIGIGIILGNMHSQKLYNEFTLEMKNKNFKVADKILAKCHIISAVFKTFTSQKAVKVSRQISTRDQYSIFRTTGIPYSINYIVSSTTYEGDNNVLYQQIARYILKQGSKAVRRPQIKQNSLSQIVQVYEYVSSSQIQYINAQIKKLQNQGIGFNTVWNEKLQKDIIQVARLWGTTQVIKGYIDTINSLQNNKLRQFFNKIGKIFVNNLLIDTHQIYTYGFNLQINQKQYELTQQQFWALSHIERPLFSLKQPHQLLQRQGDWLRSRL